MFHASKYQSTQLCSNYEVRNKSGFRQLNDAMKLWYAWQFIYSRREYWEIDWRIEDCVNKCSRSRRVIKLIANAIIFRNTSRGDRFHLEVSHAGFSFPIRKTEIDKSNQVCFHLTYPREVKRSRARSKVVALVITYRYRHCSESWFPLVGGSRRSSVTSSPPPLKNLQSIMNFDLHRSTMIIVQKSEK